MNSRDVIGLYSAYREIYENQESLTEETRSDVSYAREAVTNARKRKKDYPEGHKGDNTKHEHRLAKNAFKSVVDRARKNKVNEEADITEAKADKNVRPEDLGSVRNKRGGYATSRGRRADHRETRGMRGNVGGVGGSSLRYDDNHDKDYPSIKLRGKGYMEEEVDIYDLVLDYLLDEGYCDDVESAEVIMANMSEEWLEEILESAETQTDKQLERAMKTTYKAQNMIDNRHQGRLGPKFEHGSSGEEKVQRMNSRLKSRRKEVSAEQDKRQIERVAKLKKLLGI
jgi:hypothetical protein